jgi:hypothetical protein
MARIGVGSLLLLFLVGVALVIIQLFQSAPLLGIAALIFLLYSSSLPSHSWTSMYAGTCLAAPL